MASCITEPANVAVALAKVLLVDDDPASRLALQTVLQAGGYEVDSAASSAEAISKLDENEYELVLTDLGMESPEAGLRVLAHARIVSYKPAAALICTSMEQSGSDHRDEPMIISSEDVPEFLTQVADLIGNRASRIVARSLRHL